MKIEKEIKEAVFLINHEGRGATYGEVIKRLPHFKAESVARIMRMMVNNNDLVKHKQEHEEIKFILPYAEIKEIPKRLDDFNVRK